MALIVLAEIVVLTFFGVCRLINVNLLGIIPVMIRRIYTFRSRGKHISASSTLLDERLGTFNFTLRFHILGSIFLFLTFNMLSLERNRFDFGSVSIL